MRRAIRWLFMDGGSRLAQNAVIAGVLSAVLIVVGAINQLWAYQVLLAIYLSALLTLAVDLGVRLRSAANCRFLTGSDAIRYELARVYGENCGQIFVGSDLETIMDDSNGHQSAVIKSVLSDPDRTFVQMLSDSEDRDGAWTRRLAGLPTDRNVRVVGRFDNAVCAYDGSEALLLRRDPASGLPIAVATNEPRISKMLWGLFVDSSGDRATAAPIDAATEVRTYLRQVQEEYRLQLANAAAEPIEVRGEIAALDLYDRLMGTSSVIRAIDSLSLDSYVREAIWHRLYSLDRPELKGIKRVERILVVPRDTIMDDGHLDSQKVQALRTIHDDHVSRGHEVRYLAGSMAVFEDSPADKWMSRTTGWVVFDDRCALWTQTGEWDPFGGNSARLYQREKAARLLRAFSLLFSGHFPHAPLHSDPDTLVAALLAGD